EVPCVVLTAGASAVPLHARRTIAKLRFDPALVQIWRLDDMGVGRDDPVVRHDRLLVLIQASLSTFRELCVVRFHGGSDPVSRSGPRPPVGALSPSAPPPPPPHPPPQQGAQDAAPSPPPRPPAAQPADVAGTPPRA